MNNDLPLCLLIATFTGALMLLIPHISPRRYFFAITVPAGFRVSDAGRSSLRRYYAVVVCGVVVTAVALVQLAHFREAYSAARRSANDRTHRFDALRVRTDIIVTGAGPRPCLGQPVYQDAALVGRHWPAE